MWKRKPVVASAVGGIVDQIERRRLTACSWTIRPTCGRSAPPSSRSCGIREEAAQLGENARQRVTDEFLGDRHLEQYGRLFEQLARKTS